MSRRLLATTERLMAALLHSKNATFRTAHGVAFKSTYSTTHHSSEPAVLVEKDDHITLIGLNRAQKRNAMDTDTARALCEALAAFENDVTSPVAVLYGIGGSLSAGADIMELDEQLENGSFNRLLKETGSMGPTRRHLHKPVVCGINGYCVAGGLELALLCDLRVMEDTAILGFFGRNSGLFLRDGGTARLPALIGYSRAMDLLLTGRRVCGREALQIGLVDRLVATGTALGQAVNLAFSIAKFPLAALQRDRTALYKNCYARREGFDCAIKREVIPVCVDVQRELKEGLKRFKSSEINDAKLDACHIRPKILPDWEKEEIEYEKRAIR